MPLHRDTKAVDITAPGDKAKIIKNILILLSRSNIKFKKINKVFFAKLSDLSGQALHAKSLGFIHPRKNNWLNFESNLPDDFKKLLNLLKKLSS